MKWLNRNMNICQTKFGIYANCAVFCVQCTFYCTQSVYKLYTPICLSFALFHICFVQRGKFIDWNSIGEWAMQHINYAKSTPFKYILWIDVWFFFLRIASPSVKIDFQIVSKESQWEVGWNRGSSWGAIKLRIKRQLDHTHTHTQNAISMDMDQWQFSL